MADFMRILAEIPSFVAEGTDGLDIDAVRTRASQLSAAGYDAIAAGGLWGEYNHLTCAEQLDLIRAVFDGAGKCMAVAGAMDAGTDKAARRIAEHAGVDCHGHLCTVPYYFSINDTSEIYRHFDALAASDPDGTLFIADSPARTGYRLPPEVRRRLCASHRAVIVDCEPDIIRTSIYSASGMLAREEPALCGAPAHPHVSSLAALFPKLMREPSHLPESVRNALLTLLSIKSSPTAAIKFAAWRLGLCASAGMLAPFRGFDPAETGVIDVALATVRAWERRYGHV